MTHQLWAAAAKVESAESVLADLRSQAVLNASAGLNPEASLGSVQALAPVAKAVDPSRISFTGRPSFDPRPFLSPDNVLRFDKPLSWAAASEPIKPVPKVQVRCPHHQVRSLLKLFDEGGRLALHPYEEVDLSRACGLFTVPKDEKRDRLVLDARPSNAYESPECEWTRSLGSLAQLQYLFLQPSEKLLIHAEDLRDFYHCFSVGAERSKRNCLKLRVRPSLCRGLTAYTPELEKYAWLVPSLHTLAMGDTSAVGLAQCAHLGLVLSTQAVELASFISLEGRPPRKGPVCGLMIDDFIVLDRVPKSLSASDCQESSGRRIIREVRAAMMLWGFPAMLARPWNRLLRLISGAASAMASSASFVRLSSVLFLWLT